MFFKKKKLFLFTFGNYFWGYEHILIKAKNESEAVWRFLQPNIQTRPLLRSYEINGKKYSCIGDDNNWIFKEIEVIK